MFILIDFNRVFMDARSFDGPLESWRPVAARSMKDFCFGALSFSQDLCHFHEIVTADVNTDTMFLGTACPSQQDPFDGNGVFSGSFCFDCNLNGKPRD